MADTGISLAFAALWSVRSGLSNVCEGWKSRGGREEAVGERLLDICQWRLLLPPPSLNLCPSPDSGVALNSPVCNPNLTARGLDANPPTVDRWGGSLPARKLLGRFRWLWVPDASLLGLVRSGIAWVCCTCPQRCDEPGPSGRYRAGMRCLRVLPMSPLLQEQKYRHEHPCPKFSSRNSTKSQHRRWGRSYCKSCSERVSERGRCWQSNKSRRWQEVWEASRISCGERHWRSSNPVALSPSRFTWRSGSRNLDSSLHRQTGQRR